MAHIRCTLRRHFTGQIGPVVFTNGHGETDDPETLAYFEANPDEFEVVEGSLPIPQGDSSDPDETDPDTDPQE